MMTNGIQGTTMFRGLLALAVALEHADLFGVGYFPLLIGRSAVIGFFVLSGWVMAWYFYSNNRTMNKETLIDFYSRRIFRLGPLLILNFLLVSLLMGKFFWWELAGLLPINIYAPPKFFNLVLWTLFVEIQFYIFVPWLVFWVKKSSWGIKQHLLLYIFVFLAPRFIDVFLLKVPVDSAQDPRSFLGTFSYFYAGLVFCHFCVFKARSPFFGQVNQNVWMMLLGSGLLAAVFFPINHILYFWGGVHAIVFMSLCAIELSRRYWPNFKDQVQGCLRGLWILGEVSYGYYIFHGFWLGILENDVLQRFGLEITRKSWQGAVCLIVIPLGMALISSYLIEKPIAKLRLNFNGV